MLLDTVYDRLTENIKHWLVSNCSDRGRVDEVVKLFFQKLELFSYEYSDVDLTETQWLVLIQNLVESTITDIKPTYLSPYEGDPRDITVEAKISFKAMLDFILFIEQLMYVNRRFYAASRAVTAIDDMIRTLDEWITECRPEETLPDEYSNLVRWYRWWSDGVRAKQLENMELNGLDALGDIRDLMVNYFESRWGKRVVEYGQDGMLVYSKDSSYINRIRTKKHGYAHHPVERRQMREEYGGIDERDVVFSIEREEKI